MKQAWNSRNAPSAAWPRSCNDTRVGSGQLGAPVLVPHQPAGSPDLSVAYGTALGAGQLHAVLDVTGYFQ